MIAKDFQEATATRIVDLFRQGHNRVLLADEVGLGKTIVAKTVVEKTGVWRKEINDPEVPEKKPDGKNEKENHNNAKDFNT